MKKTHTNGFSKTEVEELRASPYVKYVSSSTVQFTDDFKRLFWEERLKGKRVAQIFSEFGIRPEVLGESRMKNFIYLLNKAADRDEGFQDGRRQNRRKASSEAGENTLEAQIRHLIHELAYTRQEVEFLKKVQAADMEARKQWESKRQRK